MYNDFPILSDEEYMAISENFNTLQADDEENQTAQIYALLKECLGFCYAPNSQFNKQIVNAITGAKSKIESALNNFCSGFDCNKLGAETIMQIDIFTFLSKLLQACLLFQNLLATQQKTYNKKVARCNIQLLNQSAQQVLDALGKSSVKFFKFM